MLQFNEFITLYHVFVIYDFILNQSKCIAYNKIMHIYMSYNSYNMAIIY